MKGVIPIKKDKVIFKTLSCNNTHTHTQGHEQAGDVSQKFTLGKGNLWLSSF